MTNEENTNPRQFLKRALSACGYTSTYTPGSALEALDRESSYSEMYEALEEEMSELARLLPDPVCQKGLVPKCRCENCRHERCRTALAHARGEK